MKVGILTFTGGTNIGQRLQNFALQKVIEECLPESEVLTIRQQYPFNRVKRDIKRCFAFAEHPMRELNRFRRGRKFRSFNKRNINFFCDVIPFHGKADISEQFDCFVVGSDQIWNPNSPYVGSNFFLEFARPEQRITYAPSFAIDAIPPGRVESYHRYLEGFSSITVREDKGAELVYELTGRKAEVVLDPTLLLSETDYDNIKQDCKLKPNHAYILAMFLGEKPEKDMEHIAEVTGLSLLQTDNATVIGPDEFLDLIENADMVLTDSYHVTIFAIIYHRPFINFSRKGVGGSMLSRFETLYRLLTVPDRTWSGLSNHKEDWFRIEYEKIDICILKEKERCRKILMNDLKHADVLHKNDKIVMA